MDSYNIDGDTPIKFLEMIERYEAEQNVKIETYKVFIDKNNRGLIQLSYGVNSNDEPSYYFKVDKEHYNMIIRNQTITDILN